ncbi:MAG: hypothetical protein ACI8S6_003187 [Myxococcota bacterium]|jgi:hypothetical protein
MRSGYGVPFAFGGFMLIYAAMYVIAPAIIGIATGDELSGFKQDRDADLLPLLMLGGGLAIMLYTGSYYLRQRVESEDASIKAGTTPVDRLAESLSLGLEVDPVKKHKMLTGRRGATWVAVHLERRRTRIVARHGLRLPEDFRISAGAARGDRFGNVVLDGALVGQKLSALEMDWTHPRTTALLMEVLHQHPGSHIDGTNIVVVGKLKQSELDGVLDAVAALAERLGERPAPPVRPVFPGRG